MTTIIIGVRFFSSCQGEIKNALLPVDLTDDIDLLVTSPICSKELELHISMLIFYICPLSPDMECSTENFKTPLHSWLILVPLWFGASFLGPLPFSSSDFCISLIHEIVKKDIPAGLTHP